MSRKKIVLFLLLLCVSACSQVEPFIDSRREAGQTGERLYVGSSKKNAPVVCHNGLWTDFEKVQKLADEECVKNGTGTKAVFDRKEVFSCRLLAPQKSFFKCVR
ncbi:MAG: hypothetical protein J6T72_04480 [Alphaproteobacteria bacterium]|nr:hypothetical protein [Alphaproteobacteria bacterium]